MSNIFKWRHTSQTLAITAPIYLLASVAGCSIISNHEVKERISHHVHFDIIGSNIFHSSKFDCIYSVFSIKDEGVKLITQLSSKPREYFLTPVSSIITWSEEIKIKAPKYYNSISSTLLHAKNCAPNHDDINLEYSDELASAFIVQNTSENEIILILTKSRLIYYFSGG